MNARGSEPEREPPHNLEAEQAVIGAILQDPEMLPKVRPYLEYGDFFNRYNGVIYRAMLHLLDTKIPPDTVTLIDLLQKGDTKKDWLEASGGFEYLSACINSVPTAGHILNYAEIVRDCAIRRRYINAGANVINLGYDTLRELPDMVSAARQAIDEAGAVSTPNGYASMTSTMGAVWD